MNIISVSNPQWANQAQTLINLSIDTDKFGVIPFTASANDVEAHGRVLFANAVAGQYGAIAPVDPNVVAAESARQARTAAIAQARADAKNDNAIQQLGNMTNAQITNYVANTPANQVLAKILMVLRADIREKYVD